MFSLNPTIPSFTSTKSSSTSPSTSTASHAERSSMTSSSSVDSKDIQAFAFPMNAIEEKKVTPLRTCGEGWIQTKDLPIYKPELMSEKIDTDFTRQPASKGVLLVEKVIDPIENSHQPDYAAYHSPFSILDVSNSVHNTRSFSLTHHQSVPNLPSKLATVLERPYLSRKRSSGLSVRFVSPPRGDHSDYEDREGHEDHENLQDYGDLGEGEIGTFMPNARRLSSRSLPSLSLIGQRRNGESSHKSRSLLGQCTFRNSTRPKISFALSHPTSEGSFLLILVHATAACIIKACTAVERSDGCWYLPLRTQRKAYILSCRVSYAFVMSG